MDNEEEEEMTIKNDPRENISSQPELSGSGSSGFAALHYALATKVDALADRQVELQQNLSGLATETRIPKPIPWIGIVTILLTTYAVMGTVGGLVVSSISERILENKNELVAMEARTEKRDSTFIPRIEVEHSEKIIQETAKRLEEVLIAQRKTEQDINITRSEFNATISGFAQRQIRNEQLIDEAKKAEILNERLNQLYGLYKLLQAQAHDELLKQLQLHDQMQQIQRNGK